MKGLNQNTCKNNWKGIGALFLGFTFSGCITHEETVHRDVERMKVDFETEAAGRIFYETLSKWPVAGSHGESKTEINIPIVFEHRHRVVSGQNASFNDAVLECDTNKDGKVTEQEARIFAERRSKR